MAELRLRVNNPNGIHCRVAGELCRAVTGFDARVRIRGQGRVAEAGSMLDIMALAAVRGAELVFEAEGPQADEALEAVARVMEQSDREEW